MAEFAAGARTIGIVGPGRLGASLARDLVNAGLPVVGVAGGAPGRAERLAAALPGCEPCSAESLLPRCQVLLLTVPDAALPTLCSTLSFRPGQLVVHCSGALPLATLEPARARGAAAGCLHPLQSFCAPEGEAGRLRAIRVGVEADAPHQDWLEALCRHLGARPLSLVGVDRAAYHAAAVFASNALVALYAAAEASFGLAGLAPQDARDALLPLSHGTLANLQHEPPARALTGPLVRGDAESLRGHVRALRADPELLTLYRALAERLLTLPLPLDAAARDAIRRALADD